MTIPVTARLDDATVAALDQAVKVGLGLTRGALIAQAVSEWLSRHGEDAVIASYQRRYSHAALDNQDLLTAIANFSVAACLANDRR